tara:strand:- start:293 stop:1024 length:732 start_codon:yes stop_codon:yes gene_type:complete
MSFLERSLLGLHGGAWLSLLGVSVLSLSQGQALNLLSDAVGGGRWWFLLGWLGFGLAVAALPTLRRALQLTGALTAIGLTAFAMTGAASNTIAMPVSLMALATVCLGSTWLLVRGRVQKARPQRTRRPRVVSPTDRAPRRDGIAIGWTAVIAALLGSFVAAWQPTTADLGSRGSVLLLAVIFIALPLMTLAYWQPRVATLALAASSIACFGLYAPGSTPLVLGLAALGMTSAGAALHLWRQRR